MKYTMKFNSLIMILVALIFVSEVFATTAMVIPKTAITINNDTKKYDNYLQCENRGWVRVPVRILWNHLCKTIYLRVLDRNGIKVQDDQTIKTTECCPQQTLYTVTQLGNLIFSRCQPKVLPQCP